MNLDRTAHSFMGTKCKQGSRASSPATLQQGNTHARTIWVPLYFNLALVPAAASLAARAECWGEVGEE